MFEERIITTTLVTTGEKHDSKQLRALIEKSKAAGNYFDSSLYEGEVAFAKLLPEDERSGLGKVLGRSWTVGEIISAIGAAGLYIRAFEEMASPANPQIPEFFTIVADHVDIPLPPLNP